MPRFLVETIRTETWVERHIVDAVSKDHAKYVAILADDPQERETGEVNYKTNILEELEWGPSNG